MLCACFILVAILGRLFKHFSSHESAWVINEKLHLCLVRSDYLRQSHSDYQMDLLYGLLRSCSWFFFCFVLFKINQHRSALLSACCPHTHTLVTGVLFIIDNNGFLFIYFFIFFKLESFNCLKPPALLKRNVKIQNHQIQVEYGRAGWCDSPFHCFAEI